MSAGDAERAFRRIYQRVARDKAFFEGVTPVEYVSLYEALHGGRLSVRLASGTYHFFDPEEVSLLAQLLPWYLHRLVRLPWLFTYRREEWGGRYYVGGPYSGWTARAVNVVLGGSVEDERRELSADEMKQLLSLFKSLIIVLVEVSLHAGRGEG